MAPARPAHADDKVKETILQDVTLMPFVLAAISFWRTASIARPIRESLSLVMAHVSRTTILPEK